MIASIVLSVILQPGSSDWKTYQNERFGYKLTYPISLKMGPVAENHAGQRFFTKDKQFQLSSWGQRNLAGETLDSKWSDELKEKGKAVHYKAKKNSWFVISGVDEKGVEFYHKAFSGHGVLVEFEITYPHSKWKAYDPWVERIEKSFVAFTGGGYDVDHWASRVKS